MKHMIIVETEEDVSLLKNKWDLCLNHIHNANDLLPFTLTTIAYHQHDDVWDIYNFGTGTIETVDGDLAGLTNAGPGMFPF